MVNTFLVCSDFVESAKLLDNKRLGKQRVEAYQILQALRFIRREAERFGLTVPSVDETSPEERRAFTRLVRRCCTVDRCTHAFGWWHHPAVSMWMGYERSLAEYMNAHIDEWVARGFENTMKRVSLGNEELAGNEKLLTDGPVRTTLPRPPRPHWTENPEFHRAHRQSLHAKAPKLYEAFATDGVFDDYLWP